MGKKNRKTPNIGRKSPKKEVKKTFLIVCEGENTEPSYFRQFKMPTINIVPIGTGCNTVSLIQEAEKLQKENIKKSKKGEDVKYDEIWCVFDKDDFPDDNFNRAITFAQNKGFKVAYSNQSFEYWFILHFEDHQGGGMNRKDYDTKINSYIKPFKVTYDGNGNKNVKEDFFNLLNGVDDRGTKRVDLAIKRARRNHQMHIQNSDTPAQSESCTTVYELVESILREAKK